MNELNIDHRNKVLIETNQNVNVTEYVVYLILPRSCGHHVISDHSDRV